MSLILTQDQVAQMLDCEVATVQSRARSGELPGLQFGRGWVFPSDALIARLNELALEKAAERRKLEDSVAVLFPPPASRRKPPVQLPDV